MTTPPDTLEPPPLEFVNPSRPPQLQVMAADEPALLHGDSVTEEDHPGATYGTFIVDGHEYALPASLIREVVPLPSSLSPLPGTPDHVLGLFRLRDEVIPVADTYQLVNGAERTAPDELRVAIIDAGEFVFGALFDRTGEVLRLQANDVVPLFHAGSFAEGVLSTGDPNRVVTLLGRESFAGTPLSPKAGGAEHEDLVERDLAQYILVRIDDLVFAIPTHQALEVHTSMPVSTTIPYFDHCVGLVELRGASVFLLDLQLVLGRPEATATERLVFLHDGNAVLAVPVDEVLEVVEIDPNRVRSIPLIDQLPSASFCHDVLSRPGERDAYCIDTVALFQHCNVNGSCPHGTGEGLLNVADQAVADVPSDTYYLRFTVGRTAFAIDMAEIREVCRPTNLTVSLATESQIAGLVNLRGDVIPLVDLRMRYNLDEATTDNPQSVIVVEDQGRPFGLVVDQLDGIISEDKTKSYGTPPEVMKQGLGQTNLTLRDVRTMLRTELDGQDRWLWVLDLGAMCRTVVIDDNTQLAA
ncbi:MAG: chemotaxis protein CheW [Myxococcota bacterium]